MRGLRERESREWEIEFSGEERASRGVSLLGERREQTKGVKRVSLSLFFSSSNSYPILLSPP